MNANLEQTMSETLQYLIRIVREGVRPEEARSGLRPIQMRNTDVKLQLVWEEEAYDDSIHYDALLTLPDQGTVSLSYCNDHEKPWPLRGVQRWSDADLVRVNNNILKMDQAIACLDFIWDESRITDRLVNVCIVQAELERNPIDVSDKELQNGMDGFRRARKLYKAEDTLHWMGRRGISYQQLEQIVIDQVTVGKLRDRIVSGRVQTYFDTNRKDFDTASIARIICPDETTARETADRIRLGNVSFFEAAKDCFIAAANPRKPDAELFARVRRRDAAFEIKTLLFDAAPNSVLGPVREEDGGYGIVLVLSVEPARFDEGTRNVIKNILFDEWLEECRKSADIEWFWGSVAKTAQSARADVAANLSRTTAIS